MGGNYYDVLLMRLNMKECIEDAGHQSLSYIYEEIFKPYWVNNEAAGNAHAKEKRLEQQPTAEDSGKLAQGREKRQPKVLEVARAVLESFGTWKSECKKLRSKISLLEALSKLPDDWFTQNQQ